jgi:ABC-type transporter Mla MlaB component
MAFPLFPKSLGKDKAAGKAKPVLTPQHDARKAPSRAPLSAREVASVASTRPGVPAKPKPPTKSADARERDITVTGPASLIDWTPGGGQPSIQVAEANPGLCVVLEDAALRYASGQAAQARQVLEQGLANDDDAKLSPLAWLALFDLLQRAEDRAAFDEFALQYVVAFERSAPVWEDRAAKPAAGGRLVPGGYFALSGKLSAASATQIANLLGATQKQPQVRLDLGSLTGADDAGTRLLADALAQLRKRRYPLALQHPEKIRQPLENAVRLGRDAGQGAWLLLLELLQWQHDHKAFEDRALDFAVTFEVSPPSWEPPPAAAGGEPEPAASTPLPIIDRDEALVFQGTMLGSGDPQLAKFAEFREKRTLLPIDMSAVDRIDFVCAGALLNAISRAESQRKTVQIIGASPIIRALLLLIGVSPRHFIKKSQ